MTKDPLIDKHLNKKRAYVYTTLTAVEFEEIIKSTEDRNFEPTKLVRPCAVTRGVYNRLKPFLSAPRR